MQDVGAIRKGAVVEMDGELYLVTQTEFRNPGNWRAIFQFKFKNLRTGTIVERRFRSQDKLEVAFVDQREAEYLYSDANYHHLMYTDTYEQEALPLDALGDDVLYLPPSTRVQIKLYNGKPLSVELPNTVRHVIKQTEPALRGATAQAQYKPAVTATGLRITVPPFVNIGDEVEIDTRTGEYLSRVMK
jgi:elongation factor P